jgi:hypothetical protein
MIAVSRADFALICGWIRRPMMPQSRAFTVAPHLPNCLQRPGIPETQKAPPATAGLFISDPVGATVEGGSRLQQRAKYVPYEYVP